MAVSKSKKTEILDNLKTLLKEANSVGFTSNVGLTVDEITNLRISLREVNATFLLAKKTLIKIAFKEVYGVELEDEMLPNPIAMVLSNEDAVAGLGKVNDFIKKEGKDKVEWTGSFFEEAIMDAWATKEIAGMPSKETLLGRLVGSLQSPLSGFARFLDAAAKKLEEEGKENLGQAEAPAKKEEPKAEEKKEEVKEEKVETPKEEKKEEAKVEEKTEAPKEEAKTEESEAPKEETK